jgi:hypothetical protein
MAESKRERSNKEGDELPITAEVGGEGGSYADAVVQEATRKGDVPRVDQSRSQPASAGRHAAATSKTTDDADDGVHAPHPQR